MAQTQSLESNRQFQQGRENLQKKTIYIQLHLQHTGLFAKEI